MIFKHFFIVGVLGVGCSGRIPVPICMLEQKCVKYNITGSDPYLEPLPNHVFFYSPLGRTLLNCIIRRDESFAAR